MINPLHRLYSLTGLCAYQTAALVPALSLHLFLDSSSITHTCSPFTVNCDFSQEALSASAYTSYNEKFESRLEGRVMEEKDVAEMPRCRPGLSNLLTDARNY